MTGNIGWLFGLGHGHYTQFLNFRECFPPEEADRAEWIGLAHEGAPALMARLPFLPAGLRLRRNQLWYAQAGLARRPEWDALFVAAEQIALLSIVRKYRTYLYTDLTPSLKRELSPWYDHQLRGSRPVRWLKGQVHRQLFRASRGVFTMSQWAAGGIRRDYGVPGERVHVVLPGANLKRWPFVDRRHRGSDTPIRILMVGGQFQLKGGSLLLEWAESTSARGWEIDIVTWPMELPDWVRRCLGSPADETRVSHSLAPRLPHVRVHCGLKANTPEIMALFKQADVFCLPTQADGSSIASLEAMASGLPVIVGAVGGIPELVRPGATGFLVRPGDSGDLKSALETVLADASLRHRVGAAARESCERVLNVDRQVREILAIIDADRVPAGSRGRHAVSSRVPSAASWAGGAR